MQTGEEYLLCLRRVGVALTLLILGVVAAEQAKAIVLQDSDVLLSTGMDLVVAGPGRLPTLLGSLVPEQAKVDSQGRIVFVATDIGNEERIFRWTPETGEREILFSSENLRYFYDIALESDESLLIIGTLRGGAAPLEGLHRVDLVEGTIAPVSIGGFLDHNSKIAIDPTDGSIAVATSSAVLRVDPDTGQQTPLVIRAAKKIAVDGSGALFVWYGGGGTITPIYRVNEETSEFDQVASVFSMKDMVFEDNGSLLVLGQDHYISGIKGLIRVDVEDASKSELLGIGGDDIALDASGGIYLSGYTASQYPVDRVDQVALVHVDPESVVSTTLIYQPLSGVTGAVIREDALGEDELLVFTENDGVIRLDPLDSSATVVASGGLLSPSLPDPSPIVNQSDEVVFLNTSSSSLLALRLNGTIRFISSGNYLDAPAGVAEESGGGSYLVASAGSTFPGVARVTDAGAQSPVVVGNPSYGSINSIVIGRASDAIINAGGFTYSVDLTTGDTSELPIGYYLRSWLALGQGGTVWLFDSANAGDGAGRISALDESENSLATVLDELPGAVSHLHPVPEAGMFLQSFVAILALGGIRRWQHLRTVSRQAE